MTAREFAIQAHGTQTYGEGTPYVAHLDAVVAILQWANETRPEAFQAAYLHDVAEDTETTVSQIGREFGPTVALLVEALTKPPKNVANRYPRYYQRLRALALAVEIKLADRIANAEACVATLDNPKSVRQLEKYREEYPRFKANLRRPVEYAKLWKRLDAVMNGG